MASARLPDGTEVPALGQGTWRMGERGADRRAEAAALRLGLDLGMALIDTAEMYAEGGAEEVVAEAIRGRRDEAFIVSKICPHNAGGRRLEAACERSLRRLRVDTIDLYLLHWRNSVPLADTVEGFERMRAAGKIRRWGVSNLDVDDLEELGAALPDCAANQVLYNLETRGIEQDLLPFCRERGMPVMAYSPVAHGGAMLGPRALVRPRALLRALLRSRALHTVAARHGATPAQVAIAWNLRAPGVITITKASNPKHVRLNAAARDLRLTEADLAKLDAAFPPPKRKHRLLTL